MIKQLLDELSDASFTRFLIRLAFIPVAILAVGLALAAAWTSGHLQGNLSATALILFALAVVLGLVGWAE